MASLVTRTDEERTNQGALIASLFDLPDAEHVSEDWYVDGYGNGTITLTVQLAREITRDQAHALLNGTAPDIQNGTSMARTIPAVEIDGTLIGEWVKIRTRNGAVVEDHISYVVHGDDEVETESRVVWVAFRSVVPRGRGFYGDWRDTAFTVDPSEIAEVL